MKQWKYLVYTELCYKTFKDGGGFVPVIVHYGFKGSDGLVYSSREEMLDAMGEAGWELVGSTTTPEGCEQYTFKKETSLY